MSGIYRVTRRDFLRYLGAGTGALVFGYSMLPDEASAKGLPEVNQLFEQIFHSGFPLNDFVRIELDGTVHIIAHRSEMGQGTRSSLAAVLADELEVDWDRVVVEQADADAYKYGVPFPVGLPGSPLLVKPEDAQFVDSSRSMAAYYMPMRFFGAGIRLVFLRAAAKVFHADVSECYARQHKVYGPHGLSLPYHLLLLPAKEVAIPTTEEIRAVLKPRKDWRYIGTDKMPFVDVHNMVTGQAVYGADLDPKRPMLTAMIERCPVANGKIKSFDPKSALAVPGVKYVTKVLPADFKGGTGGVGAAFVPHDGVAVIAENTWAALQGRRALRPTIEWDLGPHATYDSEVFRGELEASTSQAGKAVRSLGDAGSAFASTGKTVEAGYYVPLLAQAPMEPPVAVAVYDNGNFEVWTPAQGPELAQHYLGLYLLEPDPLKWLVWQAERPNNVLKPCEKDNQQAFNDLLAKLVGVDVETLYKQAEELKKSIRDRVKVHVTLLGGGFGRKSNPDYAIEAAFLARQYPGTAIRVQWTREDDIQFSFYNAVSHQHLKAGLDADGHPVALQQRSAFTSFFATLFPPPSPAFPPAMNDLLVSARAGFHNGGEYRYGSAIELSQGLQDMPYDIKNLQLENCPAESHIRCGWMRSVANIYHAFGLCSFADEMAIAAGRDSKDYLLDLIGQGYVLHQKDLEAQGVQCLDNNQFPVDQLLMVTTSGQLAPIASGYAPDGRRLRAVVERVAKESGWNEKVRKYKGTRRGLGIAAHRSFLSYVAIVVDVSLSEANELTVNEIYGVIDCGFAVNLDRVRAQMEGGINYGLSYALLGEISVKNGAVEQNNFNDYPVLRIHQAPKQIYTFIEEPSAEVAKDYPNNEVPPTGAGEPPTPAVAPALANAIVAAGGPRIREIPFRKSVRIL